MRTPVFSVHPYDKRDRWDGMVLFLIALMAFLSAFLVMGAWIALSFHPSGILLFPLAIWFARREGFFHWITDLRAQMLRRRPALREAVAACSATVLREAVLSPAWDRFQDLAKPDLDQVRFVWEWSPQGLAAVEIHLTTPHGLQHIPGYTHDLLGYTPTIGWDDPALRYARSMRASLVENRFGPALLSIAGPLPRGSAHARLALRAWAMGPAAGETDGAGQPQPV